MLIVDLETRSRCDLKTAGAYNYARHDSTQIICFGYKINDEPSQVVYGDKNGDIALPNEVVDYLAESEGYVAAHNAAFDRTVLEFNPATEQLMRHVALERWICTAALARINGLPDSLANATRAVFGENRKDFRGSRLIQMLSLPQPDGTFNYDPVLIKEMGEYCLRDVDAVYELMGAVRQFSQHELADYHINERVNCRGVAIDIHLARHAQLYATAEVKSLSEELRHITAGRITSPTQVARIKKWVLPKLSDDAIKLTETWVKGERKNSLDKNVRHNLLTGADEGVIELSDDVYNVLAILDEGNMSSVAKFKRMEEFADPHTRRVYGAFVYAGASQTKRFASRGLQIHNFTRDCLSPEDTDRALNDILRGKPLSMVTLRKMLRPALVPAPWGKFIVGDWSAIEARGLPYLSDSAGGDRRLDMFRDNDADPEGTPDLYTVTSNRLGLGDRQLGKILELSLGFGGGAGAFNAMARNYAMPPRPEHEVKNLVTKWRGANEWAVNFWSAIARAAMRAVAEPNTRHNAGRVGYYFNPDLLDGTLFCILPDGTVLQYPKVRMETQDGIYGTQTVLTAMKANWTPAAGQKEWPRVTLWHGLLVENATQGFCAALLRDLMRRLHTKVFDNAARPPKLVAHVHDEIIMEAKWDEAERHAAEVRRMMCETPAWAKGLPLNADVKVMARYGK